MMGGGGGDVEEEGCILHMEGKLVIPLQMCMLLEQLQCKLLSAYVEVWFPSLKFPSIGADPAGVLVASLLLLVAC
ncbi:hypothetical protein L195_g024216 [Trifolium pratense]|uniref:Uncharacterized protein n=1 Tax=Trifolium pratense TaxID=57577 RepID=A0A2K3ND39_TRIPR|nr:hypothetical protein L195_g024216 [Trifolium pratense]